MRIFSVLFFGGLPLFDICPNTSGIWSLYVRIFEKFFLIEYNLAFSIIISSRNKQLISIIIQKLFPLENPNGLQLSSMWLFSHKSNRQSMKKNE